MTTMDFSGSSTTAKNKKLLRAAKDGDASNALELIAGGADVHTKDDDGRTPLHWVSRDGHATVVKALLARGADVQIKDNNGQTPLNYATRRGHVTVVNALLARGASIAAKNKNLLRAAKDGDAPKVLKLIAGGADVNAEDDDGWTPLRWASANGHVAVVQALLASRANVNTRDTGLVVAPLHQASQNGHAAVVEALLAGGADVNARTHHQTYGGLTPLHWASEKGHAAVVEALLANGANVHARDDHRQRTPLHSACAKTEIPSFQEIVMGPGHAAVVEALLAAGADVHAEDYYGNTPRLSEVVNVLGKAGGGERLRANIAEQNNKSKHEREEDKENEQEKEDEEDDNPEPSRHENVLEKQKQENWSEKDFVLCKVKENGINLKYASPECRNDPEIVLEAIKSKNFGQHGRELAYSDEYHGRAKVEKTWKLERIGDILEMASDDLKSNRDFILEVAKNGCSLFWIPEAFKSDKEVVRAAVPNDRRSLKYALGGLNQDPECLIAAGLWDSDHNPEGKKNIVLSTKFSLGYESSWTATEYTLLLKKHPYFKDFIVYIPNGYDKNTCDPEWTNINHPCRGTFETYQKRADLKQGVPIERECCWRYSYRYQLERSHFMVQLVEYRGVSGCVDEGEESPYHNFGKGQEIETEMADDVGLKMFRHYQGYRCTGTTDTLSVAFKEGDIDNLAKAVKEWESGDCKDMRICNLSRITDSYAPEPWTYARAVVSMGEDTGVARMPHFRPPWNERW